MGWRLQQCLTHQGGAAHGRGKSHAGGTFKPWPLLVPPRLVQAEEVMDLG